MEDTYIFIQKKKKKKEKQLPTKPKRWKILGRFMKSLEIKEWNTILPVYNTPEFRHRALRKLEGNLIVKKLLDRWL